MTKEIEWGGLRTMHPDFEHLEDGEIVWRGAYCTKREGDQIRHGRIKGTVVR